MIVRKSEWTKVFPLENKRKKYEIENGVCLVVEKWCGRKK